MQNFNPFNETDNVSFNPHFENEDIEPNDNSVFFTNEEEFEPVFGEDIAVQGQPGYGAQHYRRYPPYGPHQQYPPTHQRPMRRRARRLRRCVLDCGRYYPEYPRRYIRCINNCCQGPFIN